MIDRSGAPDGSHDPRGRDAIHDTQSRIREAILPGSASACSGIRGSQSRKQVGANPNGTPRLISCSHTALASTLRWPRVRRNDPARVTSSSGIGLRRGETVGPNIVADAAHRSETVRSEAVGTVDITADGRKIHHFKNRASRPPVQFMVRPHHEVPNPTPAWIKRKPLQPLQTEAAQFPRWHRAGPMRSSRHRC